MPPIRRVERTDGRRKGYKPFKASVKDNLPADTLRRLEALRRGQA